MKIRDGRLALAATAIILTGTAALSLDSTPVLVDAAYRNKHWMTVYTNTVPLTWDWNTNAANATLAISGMNSAFATNFASVTSNYLWQVSETAVPSEEDVYDLTLTFYATGGATVGALTSRLAVVTGSFGQTPVNPVTGSRSWSQVKSNVVIPYDVSWPEAPTNATVTTQLVIAKNAAAVETNTYANVAGYMGWKLVHSAWGYGTFGLTLSFPGSTNIWTAELTRPMDGTMIRMQ